MRSSLFAIAITAFSSLCLAAPTDLGADWLRVLERRDARDWDNGRGGPAGDDGRRFSDCNMESASLPPAPTALPRPSDGLVLSHVAVGRGTQNYSCAGLPPTGAPAPNGAVATLFNVSCVAANARRLMNHIPGVALSFSVPTSTDPASPANRLRSGTHFFTPDFKTPHFDLRADGHDYGAGGAAKLAQSDAPADAPKGPNGLGSVPWLKLGGAEGGAFREIYRVDTAGGVAPKTCEGLPERFEVEYAAMYWFYVQRP